VERLLSPAVLGSVFVELLGGFICGLRRSLPWLKAFLRSYYGGTERVVAWLVDELVELGHNVTLFASGDSSTRDNLDPAWPRALRLGRPAANPMAAYKSLLEAIATRARDFDIVTLILTGFICRC
jgi:hypothetical protein